MKNCSVCRTVDRLAVASLMMFGLLGIAAAGACSATTRQVAKTAVDVAAEACRVTFGAKPEELPPGVSLEDFCKAEENVQPFLDTILSTQRAEATKLGTVRTRVPSDAGKE